jgi:hypothetical protein
MYKQLDIATRHKYFFAGIAFIVCSGLLALLPQQWLFEGTGTVVKMMRLAGNIILPLSLLAIIDKESSARRKWLWVFFFLLQAAFQLVVYALT